MVKIKQEVGIEPHDLTVACNLAELDLWEALPFDQMPAEVEGCFCNIYLLRLGYVFSEQ